VEGLDPGQLALAQFESSTRNLACWYSLLARRIEVCSLMQL